MNGPTRHASGGDKRARSTIYINGKFAAQRVTGVQRFAIEMTRALDAVLTDARDAPRFVLMLPPATPTLGLAVIAEQTVAGPPSLHLWEQIALPWMTRRGILLNLTGSAPLLHPRQVASLLDTAIYAHPEAYTRGFVRWYRLLFWRMARRARLIVTLTEFSRRGLVARLDPKAPVVVVGAAANQMAQVQRDTAAVTDLDVTRGRYFLAVGSDNPTKNLARLAAAFARLPDPALRLVVVGGANRHVFAASNRADDPRIVRPGRIGDAALKTLYEDALAFVFPSLYEGFGLPPLEAMTCGCPVIAAAAASIPEVCGDAALYFDPTDIDDMARAMQRIASSPDLRADLIGRGHVRAQTFSWRASATALLRALGAVTNPPALDGINPDDDPAKPGEQPRDEADAAV